MGQPGKGAIDGVTAIIVNNDKGVAGHGCISADKIERSTAKCYTVSNIELIITRIDRRAINLHSKGGP